MSTTATNGAVRGGPADFWGHFMAWIAVCGGILALVLAGFFLVLRFPLASLLAGNSGPLVEWLRALVELALGIAIAFGAGFMWTLLAGAPAVLLIRATLFVARLQPSLVTLSTCAGSAVAFSATLPVQLMATTDRGAAPVFPVVQVAVALTLVYGQAAGALAVPVALRRRSGRNRRAVRFGLGQALAITMLLSILLGLLQAGGLMTASIGYPVIYALVVHLVAHRAVIGLANRSLRLRFARRRRSRMAGRST